MKPVEKVLRAVEDYEERTSGFWCICPVHDDHDPSLHVQEAKDGRALLKCRAGCDQADVLEALERRGLRRRDLFARPSPTDRVSSLNGRAKDTRSSSGGRERRVAAYPIKDASGLLVAIHERRESPSGKRFLWKHPNGEYSRRGEIRPAALPLYGSELVANWPEDGGIILVEGEKSAEALRRAGLHALGTVTGASGTHEAETLEVLTGRRVILWPDTDQAGREHMHRHAERLLDIAAAVQWYEWISPPEVRLPSGTLKAQDAADHPAVKGGDLVALKGLAEELRTAPTYDPEDEVSDDSSALIYEEEGSRNLRLPEEFPNGDSHAPQLSGSELLCRLAAYVRRYVVLTGEQADLIAIWIIHTYALDAADTTAYLEVVSAEKRSGKTRLLEVLSTVAAKPWFTGRVTAAVLVRKVAHLEPTLLLDEVERFRLRKVEPEAAMLKTEAAAWADAHVERLAKLEPLLPEELDDRAQEICEPLLAVAEAAGSDWPERARKAVIVLAGASTREDSESLGIRLLRDIRGVFEEREADRLPTRELLDFLHAAEEAPWGSLRGEPLDARGLARMLQPYGIEPKKLREGDYTFRGYRRAGFEDAWTRYAPAPPEEAEHPEHPEHAAGRTVSDVPHKSNVPEQGPDVEHKSLPQQQDVPRVPDVPPNPGQRVRERSSSHQVQSRLPRW